ncbi:MAG TPA: methyltransferase domain-containing protein, partial [Sorangium sp.]|nr:methyltransferase domain-containing protein [Sorangium sp.]
MSKHYHAQCVAKVGRLKAALDRYGLQPSGTFADIAPAAAIEGYRRRAKLVVAAAPGGGGAIGLYQRQDNQHVIDIPNCKVLRPELMALVSSLRALIAECPAELSVLLTPAGEHAGALTGIDARLLHPPAVQQEVAPAPQILLTLVLDAERAANEADMRTAADALRDRLPQVAGVAFSMRYNSRHHASSDLLFASGVNEMKDQVGTCYQLASHTSFLHVHREQAARLYQLLCKVAATGTSTASMKVLDLYGGTGAIALSLAQAGHQATLVESYPPAAALALRAAQAQRLAVEVVTGDVASVTKALAAAGSTFDVVVANPPRRGLSPAAREAIAALKPARIVYVACDLNNLGRDVDHLARLGFQLQALHPLDMLPLTEEVEVVAVLTHGQLPPPSLLYQDDEILVFNKPAHEPLHDRHEYPVSLASRARAHFDGGEWVTVLETDASTSGVCLVARDQQTADAWIDALTASGRLVYLAAARGVTPAKGAITRELRAEE